MADAIARRPVTVTATPWLRSLPASAKFILRGDPDALAAAGQRLGLALPTSACRAAANGARAGLWLGPDEFLLLAPENEATAVATDLAAAFGVLPHSLVDVSHRQVTLELNGPQAEWLLGAQCPLPLDLRAFSVGMCTRTVFAKAEIVLWRTAPETFHMEVARSFTQYVVDLLHEIARESVA
ncbi:MAG: sarcosine oxidase subunit gamma family protein [Rubrivivax sp.]|jgi:sarcosine oxidase, subunit gamma|nr:sarcosine oxidase subunit gamma family protein [Rubrivivax sp.]